MAQHVCDGVGGLFDIQNINRSVNAKVAGVTYLVEQLQLMLLEGLIHSNNSLANLAVHVQWLTLSSMSKLKKEALSTAQKGKQVDITSADPCVTATARNVRVRSSFK